MKTALSMAMLMIVAGCAANPPLSAPVAAGESGVPAAVMPLTSLAPVNLLLFRAQSQSVIQPPPPPPEIILHFIYPVWPLTNGYLESSTDLVHWVLRVDFTNDAAGDWHLTNNEFTPSQFFRAGGETIPQ